MNTNVHNYNINATTWCFFFAGGQPLPLQCNPTSSSPGNGSRPARSKKKSSHTPCRQGLRSQDTIHKLVESTSEENSYRPLPTGTVKLEKCTVGQAKILFVRSRRSMWSGYCEGDVPPPRLCTEGYMTVLDYPINPNSKIAIFLQCFLHYQTPWYQ